MLRPISKFTLTQVPTKEFPKRNKVFTFSHCVNFKSCSTWQNLSDTGGLVLPLKVPVIDSDTGSKVYLDFKKLIENETSNPYFLRGDKIKVELGFIYLTDQGEKRKIETVFIGYISQIEVKQQLTLKLMDEMYVLQQTLCKNKTYKNATLKTVLVDQIGDKYQITKNVSDANLGDFVIGGEGPITIAELLNYVRDTYKIEFFFHFQPDDSFILYCNGFAYLPQFRKNAAFAFQQNIVSDNLEWFSTKDIRIRVVVKSTVTENLGKSASGKNSKTRKKVIVVTVGDPLGETRTINKIGITDTKQLMDIGNAELNKLYYEGFRGSFKTFGLPLTKHGYACKVTDPILPQRTGTYLVKQVDYEFGVGGYFQDITLAIKIADGDAKIY